MLSPRPPSSDTTHTTDGPVMAAQIWRSSSMLIAALKQVAHVKWNWNKTETKFQAEVDQIVLFQFHFTCVSGFTCRVSSTRRLVVSSSSLPSVSYRHHAVPCRAVKWVYSAQRRSVKRSIKPDELNDSLAKNTHTDGQGRAILLLVRRSTVRTFILVTHWPVCRHCVHSVDTLVYCKDYHIERVGILVFLMFD